jgi:hypothetical protein
MNQPINPFVRFSRRINEKITTLPFSAEIAALAGVLVYIIAAFRDAHDKLSFLDEGLYLFKGLLFATRQFTPFQDFGVWTNHMPFAFLIPGQIQEWFGAGLRTGRYFSIFLSILMLIGLWLTVKSLSGKWWAAGTIWAYALNPAAVKLYTIAISQAIIACMFVWMLFFCLGKEKRIWQLIIAGAISGLMILTRENMVPVFPILIIYIWWRFGWRSGTASFLSGMIVLIIGHAAFWPGILQIWANWIPARFSPFLNPWRLITDGIQGQTLIPDKAGFLVERATYIWLVIRQHFVSVIGVVASILLFPRKQEWQSNWKRQTAIFLAVLYLVLFAFHLYATFGMDYCVSCILLYISFFDFVGIILFALTIPSVQWVYPKWRNILNWVVIIATTIGILFSSLEDIIQPLFSGNSEGLTQFSQRFLPGLISSIQEAFKIRYYPAVRMALSSILLVGLLLILVLLVSLRKRIKFSGIMQKSANAMVIFVVIGFLLSPTVLFGSGNNFFNCGGDVIKSYEETGKSISQAIPPGSTVFWEGRSDAIFLYLPGIKIYPPQLNHVHGFYQEGDETELLRMGRYNNHSAGKWFSQADFILVEQEWVKKWQAETLDSGIFKKIGNDFALGQCDSAGKLQLYQRISP